MDELLKLKRKRKTELFTVFVPRQIALTVISVPTMNAEMAYVVMLGKKLRKIKNYFFY